MQERRRCFMNKFLKGLLPVVLVLALLVASMPAFAAKSPTTKAIGFVKVSSATYSGKTLTPKVKVYDITGKKISSKYYSVKVSGKPKNAGTYKVTVTGKAPYTGKKVKYFVIKKAKNPFKIKVGRQSFKVNKKRSQSTSIRISGVKGGAKVYRWTSTSPKVYVKGGRLIIRKGFRGTATIGISTGSTKNYKATRKTIRIRVK